MAEELSRRKFLKQVALGTAAVAATAAGIGLKKARANEKDVQYAMVIDLQKCVGCGGCIVACKNENNVQEGFAWSFKDVTTTGTFPNVRYEYIPRLCNHCQKAPCVEICPTNAMHKEDGGITAHTPDICIGCLSCVRACPYTNEDTWEGVIQFNAGETHKFWKDKKPLIKKCTDSPRKVVSQAKGDTIPYYNPDREKFREGSGLRKKGIVEKCTFCDHRLKSGKLPYCVVSCPPRARIFGDLNDPNSNVSKVLSKYRPMRLKEYEGTEPKVFYVRDFNPGVYETLEERHKKMNEV